MPDRRAAQRERDAARNAWRQTVPFGANTAAFEAGEVMRCPVTVCTGSGLPAICGGFLGHAEVKLRVRSIPTEARPGRAPPGALMRTRCRQCDTPYRVTAELATVAPAGIAS